MKIFFDLDGTLIDSKQRLYLLFQKLVPKSNFSFDEYWSHKKNKLSNSYILSHFFSYSKEEIGLFEKEWMEKIELREWLSFDQPFAGVTEYLKEQKKLHDLYVVTARQFKELVQSQLEQFGWEDIFKGILVTAQKQEKIDLIKEITELERNDWLVGDTGKDIQTGRALGLRTAAVLTGFLSRERLEEYNPDIIIGRVQDLNFT